MSKIKYMGTADVRRLDKGENFDGRLADGLPQEVVWDRRNHWIVDSGEAGLSEDAVKLLLAEPGFKDVTDLKRIPSNEHQKMFLGHPASEPADEPLEVPESTGPDEGGVGSGGARAGTRGRVGGSTRGTT